MQQLRLWTGTAIWWLPEPHCINILKLFNIQKLFVVKTYSHSTEVISS